MRSFACLAAVAAVTIPAVAFEAPASAEPGLPVGACIVTGYGTKGVVVAVTRGGYRVRATLTGLEWEETQTGVKAAPCPPGAGGPNPPPAPPQRPTVQRPYQPPATQRPGGGACFASQTGGAGLEGSFRGVIRRQFEKPALTGADGAVTSRFLSFRMDGGRRATPVDQVNYNPDTRRPVYSIRALIETCTDYRRATDTRTIERNFQCFTSSTGGYNCSASGSMAGMRRDSNVYVPK